MQTTGSAGFRVRDGRGRPHGPPWPGRSAPRGREDGPLHRQIAKLLPDGENWDRTDYYHTASWQVVEERFADGQGAPDTPAATARHQYVWSLRYIDAAVCRDADTDADGNCTDGGGSERLYYTNDAQMDVTSVVNSSGAVQEHYYQWQPYGGYTLIFPTTWAASTIHWSASKKNELLFAGYRYDADANVYHVRHRVYHPTLGRWGQRDPIGYVDGMSAYQYVQGSALEGTDPSGLSASIGTEPDTDDDYCCADKLTIRTEGPFSDETSVLDYLPPLIGRAPERFGAVNELGRFLGQTERNQVTGEQRRWVGVKVEFIGSTSGTTQELCDMEQKISINMERKDGRPSPREGTTFDDFGRAGASRSVRRSAPFRQSLANGDVAWMDVPSRGYTGQESLIESQRILLTCFVSHGSKARQMCPFKECCVEWSVAIIVKKNKVGNTFQRRSYVDVRVGRDWCANWLAG